MPKSGMRRMIELSLESLGDQRLDLGEKAKVKPNGGKPGAPRDIEV